MSTPSQTEAGKLNIPTQEIISCDDVACEILVDPIARPEPPPFKVTIQPQEQRVVIIDNNKPNSMAILTRARAILRARAVEVNENIPVKENAGQAMPAEMMSRFFNEKGLVISGIND
jgi:hypothetical protein